MLWQNAVSGSISKAPARCGGCGEASPTPASQRRWPTSGAGLFRNPFRGKAKRPMKTEAKHTPGPWKVNAILDRRIVGDDSVARFDALQINGVNSTVATVYRRADSRLIAAAPE